MRTEKIMHGGEVLALAMYSGKEEEGIQFYTEDNHTLQVGKHFYTGGKIIKPHRHIPVKVQREETLREVLYIEKGKVKITFYTDEWETIDSRILNKGDMILLIKGGHGFEMLEELWESNIF